MSEAEIIKHWETRLQEIQAEKEKVLKTGKFEEAAALRDVEIKLKKELVTLKESQKTPSIFDRVKDAQRLVGGPLGLPQLPFCHNCGRLPPGCICTKAEVPKEGKAHGMRFNDGKLKWGYMHYKSMEPMIRVLMFGAQKYEPFNWQKGLKKEEVLESMQRHLAKIMDGEENDPESGLNHIGHVMCNAMFWSYMDLKERGEIT